MAKKTNSAHFKKYHLLLIVLILLAGFFIQREIHKVPTAKSITTLESMPLLTLDHVQRMLVFAPHPDDESLGPGGLIQIALEKDIQVKVVVVTNGDGQREGPTIVDKETPLPKNYIKFGEQRQEESLRALERLGVSPKNVIYLGYPDRGVGVMWNDDWTTQCPFIAPFTRVTVNPYPDTYNPHANYCGKDLLDSIKTIMDDFRPDLVVVSHPADQHPDHGGVSNFVRMAAAILEDQYPDYQPLIWGYLVHYNNFPQPRGKKLDQILLPPELLASVEYAWGRVELSPEQVQTKLSAIEDYPSQDLLLGGFLVSFARTNEMFEILPAENLQTLDYLSISPREVAESTTDPEAANLQTETLPVRRNMLAGWNILRLNNNLTFYLQLHRDFLPETQCVVHFKFPDGRTFSIETKPTASFLTTPTCTVSLDLAAQGSPQIISFSTEIKQGGLSLSRTGWHFLFVK